MVTIKIAMKRLADKTAFDGTTGVSDKVTGKPCKSAYVQTRQAHEVDDRKFPSFAGYGKWVKRLNTNFNERRLDLYGPVGLNSTDSITGL